MKSKPKRTPLQGKLAKLADRIGLFGVGAAFATFVALVIRWGVLIAMQGWHPSLLLVFLRYFVLCATIIVVAVCASARCAVQAIFFASRFCPGS